MLRYRFVLTAALVTCIALPASAQEDPRKAQAEALFQEGLKLHDKDRESEAVEKYQKAYATYPSPNILLNLAVSEKILGQNVKALRHFREAVRNPLLNPKGLPMAKKAIAELEPKVARVDVRGPAGLVVKVDGEELRLPLAEPLDLEPGTVVATGTLDSERYEGRVLASVGSVTTLEMKPSSSGAATSSSPASTSSTTTNVEPPPVVREKSFWDTGRIAGVAAFGVGLVGVGAGVLFASKASDDKDKADAFQNELGPSGCSGVGSPKCGEWHDARDSQDRNATLSTVFVISGAVVAATGVALFVWPRKEAPHVVPAVSRDGGGLTLFGTF
ncbi:hypothetical protein AKJ09_01406 [Labilithrix luteola]|uniref:Uncharacterized protein n=1 Tax=Labilithrix luteola TaxID=1391654 RepID=A0A0K1PMK6_9BACT|nr:hypothetical protein [Labilithrix luteola]AKU94742.1 hypothetical protein AKJ09_01406 [Labilithrix luteola]